jgi:hypothetical protein
VVCESFSDKARTNLVNYGVALPTFLQPLEPGGSVKFDAFVIDEPRRSRAHRCTVESRPEADPVTTVKR